MIQLILATAIILMKQKGKIDSTSQKIQEKSNKQSERSFQMKIGQCQMDISLVNKNEEMILSLILTSSQDAMYKAELRQTQIPSALLNQFESLKWVYLYIQENKQADCIFVDKDFTICLKKLKYMTKTQFIEKIYKIQTVRQQTSQQQLMNKLCKKIKTLEKKISEKQFNDCQQRRIKKLEQELQEIKTNQLKQLKQEFEQIKNNRKKYFEEIKYRFSSTLKHQTIVVSQNDQSAEKIGGDGHVFIVLSNSIGLKDQKLTVLIAKKAHWISFGWASLSCIKKSNFKDECGNQNSYSISTNKQVYNLKKPASTHNLQLNTGDIVNISINDNKILFFKKDQTNAFVLQMNLTEEDWKDGCMFVNFYRAGDSIRILN